MKEIKIKREKTLFEKALIICNGEPPPDHLLFKLWEDTDFRVAADGGANRLISLDLIPDAVVGDFDSLSHEAKNQLPDSILFHIKEQETNDADKAVRHCLSKGFSEINLVGADGRRQDQFLSSLEILFKYSSKARIILWTPLERMEFVWKEWEENLPLGTTISLLPIFGGAESIITKGLKFKINNSALVPGKPPSGVSNLVESNPVSITLKNGQLLLVVQLSINFSTKNFSN